MKNSIIIAFILSATLCSCQPSKQKLASANTFMLDTLINGKKLMVKDTTKYSPEFIQQLKQAISVNESIKLIGDSIWVSSTIFNSRKDTLVTTTDIIPTVLKISEPYLYTTSDTSHNFTLTLKRNNFTDIEYLLEKEGKVIQKGTAMLQSTFYLAKEVSDDETGGQLFLDQYIDGSRNWAAIKIETSHGKIVLFSSTNAEVKTLGKLPVFKRN